VGRLFGLTLTGNYVSEREKRRRGHRGPRRRRREGRGRPDAAGSIPRRSPPCTSRPLNHVGLWSDDLPRAVEWLTARGVRFAPGGIRKGAAGFDITFIHPKGNADAPIGGEGVLIELVQAPAEVIAAFAALAT